MHDWGMEVIAQLLSVLVVVAGLGGMYTGYRHGVKIEAAKLTEHLKDDAEAEAKAMERATALERELAAMQVEISYAYEQGKQEAEASANRVVVDLRNGALRLRQQWAACKAEHMPETPTAASEPDAAPTGREESAARIVRAAAECDAQVRGLQELLIAERQQYDVSPAGGGGSAGQTLQ